MGAGAFRQVEWFWKRRLQYRRKLLRLESSSAGTTLGVTTTTVRGAEEDMMKSGCFFVVWKRCGCEVEEKEDSGTLVLRVIH